MNDIKLSVQNYYSEVIKNSGDLKTSACCVAEAPPAWLRGLIQNICPEILEKFYGCGFPFSEAIENCTVVDLGCGTGRDAYLYSQLVGEHGKVIGIDMTEAQLNIAKKFTEEHRLRFGYAKSNVEFLLGDIENLAALNIHGKVDLITSNCVVNLSTDKKAVLNGVSNLLKEGGEFYFSDIFCDRRLAPELSENTTLYGECLAGALYINDFISIAKSCGFNDPRLVSENPVDISTDLQKLIGNAHFTSRTYRLFKISSLEDNCEDYGQIAEYLGNITHHPHLLKFDQKHYFETGRPERVCGNTAEMISQSRYKPFFKITGTKSTHFGEFDCQATIAAQNYQNISSSNSCC